MSADKGWEFISLKARQSSGEGEYHSDDGSYAFFHSDGSAEYYGADGSYGTIYSDGSGSYTGADGSRGYLYSDGDGSYTGADGSRGYLYSDGDGSYTGADGHQESISSGGYSSYSGSSTGGDASSSGVALGAIGAAIALGSISSRRKRRKKERQFRRLEREAARHARKIEFRQKHKKGIRITKLIIFLVVIGTLKYFDIKNAIPLGYSADEVRGMNYEIVEQQLEETGFWFVWPSPVYDLELRDIELDGTVIEVKVNWKTNFKESSRFPVFSIISIEYHSLKKITVPMSSKDAEGMDYNDVVAAFEAAGFVSIRCETKPDLITGWITKEFSVDSITINGNNNFSSEYTARPDAEVVITYHTFD